jgi:hypothetical protein
MLRMDAQEPEPSSERITRRTTQPIFVRCVAAWLAVVLVLGLWQGYGAWLLGGIHAG